MASPYMLHLLLAFITLPFLLPHRNGLALAQYEQDYTWRYIGNVPSEPGAVFRTPFWRPDPQEPYVQGVVTDPAVIILEYNCYYMRDICTNSVNFENSARGQARPQTNVFGFHLNKAYAEARGARACPGSWKKNHVCPETSQQKPMKQDGEWFTTALEPNTDINELAHERDNQGNIIKRSWIRYTCDEFPPKTFIEGGMGPTNPGATEGSAQTRCAAFRCNNAPRRTKAEQNWQATSHNNLRLAILKEMGNRRSDFPDFNKKTDFVMFGFRRTNAQNGIAAKVYTWSDLDQTNLIGERPVTQVKRSERDYLEFLNSVTVEELTTMGGVREIHVHANHTHDQVSHVNPLDADMFSGLQARSLEEYLDSDLEDYLDDADDQDLFLNQDDGLFNTTSSITPEEPAESAVERSVAKTPKRRVTEVAMRDTSHPSITPLLKNATDSDITKARKIVENALDKAAKLNSARYAKPIRNIYSLRPGTVVGEDIQGRTSSASSVDIPRLLEITDEIANAAALVAEAESSSAAGNVTKRAVAASGSYWMEHLDRKGTVPWGDDPDYKVFRNVLDYGAVGDGVTDDTKAIKEALNDGKRCGEKCNGSTTKNAIVYFPPGKYLVSTGIPIPFGTQIIGDANDWPTIVASKIFIGLGVLSVNEYTGGGTGPDGLDQQWYINTANFYRQMRNLRIDVTQTRSAQQVAGLHYQVAQATSLQNLEIIASTGTKQRGIFAENGSGGVMSDVTFRGGAFGLYGGEQQFTAQRLKFDGCATGVQIIWDWGWIWKSIEMNNVDVGFRLVPEENSSRVKRQAGVSEEGSIGSISVYDSSFSNVGTVVLIEPPSSEKGSGSTGVIIENVSFSDVGKAVTDTGGETILAPSSKIDHWALGPVYAPDREFSQGKRIAGFRRQPDLLDDQGNYFERMKPQYEDRAVDDFVHVKDFGAKGDGETDDTAAFQKALYSSQGKILFVDAGSYILTGTVTIPSGSKIVGETWSQLVASGSYFGDATDPKVMIKVGKDGEVGDIEMQDIIFTNRGATAGLILVEWNIRASNAGSAALWDCHVRIGGATGTELTPEECPALTSGIAEGCNAASLMMHITPAASGYFENMWLWVADHMIDDPDLEDANNTMVQNSVYVARGLLVESREPTWLYGTSSEHAVYYQYNFNKASNIFAGMIQTESPYYQPTPKPPSPFTDAVGVISGDPTYECKADDEFSGCDESWALIIRRSSNILIAGAGMYSWFSTYTQDCIDELACQKVLMLLDENSSGVRIQQIITIGAEYMAVQDGQGIKAADNLNVEFHPRWSQVSVWDVSGDGTSFDKAIWIDPKIWEMDQPEFTCSAPCVAKIPPWQGATRTVDYPILTVSDGTWTSKITRAPLTITEVLFEVVTLAQGGGDGGVRKRQNFGEFWPTPETTPFWPRVTYAGPDGSKTTTAPTVKFPDPPSSIGPDASAPTKGSWPLKAVRAVEGREEMPLVGQCYFQDFGCIPNPWEYGGMEGPPDEEPDDYDEDAAEAKVTCPTSTSSETTTSEPSTTTKEPIAIPVPSPMENEKDCYNSGRGADNTRIGNAIESFCDALADDGDILDAGFFKKRDYPFPISGIEIGLKVVVSLEIKSNCEWKYTNDECQRYGRVPVDSCDCDGENGKHGGYVRNNCLVMRVDPNNDW